MKVMLHVVLLCCLLDQTSVQLQLRVVSCQLLQPTTARVGESVTTTFIMESIIHRTLVIVEEKVGGKLVNRTVNEVSSPCSNINSHLSLTKCLYFYLLLYTSVMLSMIYM